MKLKYKNVCSIKEAEVEFEPGKLYCICGESNQGKSSMFYSLLAGLVNSPMYKNFINKQALSDNSKATAQIEMIIDQNIYEIEAGTGHMKYTINGEEYSKLGRKSIFDILQGQIPSLLYDPEDTRQIMNISGEDDGLFPIDRSDAQIFKTYERLLSLSSTEDVLRQIKLDNEDVDYKTADLTKNINQNQQQLNQLSEVLKNIDRVKLNTIFGILRDILTRYSITVQALNSNEKSNTYVKKVFSTQEFRNSFFDVQGFSRLLQSLIQAGKVKQYIDIQERGHWGDVRNQFDAQAYYSLEHQLGVATTLQNEIQQLNLTCQNDELLLQDIEAQLSTIKTCPMCGQEIERKEYASK
jgi:ABC-type dipeptide/oligopeptide/nickel transport system ATPase subunit